MAGCGRRTIRSALVADSGRPRRGYRVRRSRVNIVAVTGGDMFHAQFERAGDYWRSALSVFTLLAAG